MFAKQIKKHAFSQKKTKKYKKKWKSLSFFQTFRCNPARAVYIYSRGAGAYWQRFKVSLHHYRSEHKWPFPKHKLPFVWMMVDQEVCSSKHLNANGNLAFLNRVNLVIAPVVIFNFMQLADLLNYSQRHESRMKDLQWVFLSDSIYCSPKRLIASNLISSIKLQDHMTAVGGHLTQIAQTLLCLTMMELWDWHFKNFVEAT